jgi:Domain of Unknown Function (DUF1080)
MKWKRGAGAFMLAWLTLSMACRHSAAQITAPNSSLAGRWDLTLTTPSGKLPSWIEMSFTNGSPKVLFVGAMDHAVPPKALKINGSEFEFASPKGEEGFPQNMLFRGKFVDDKLAGTVTGDAGAKWTFAAVRAPALDRKETPQWGPPIKLFNEVDLSGWTLHDPSKPGSWKVEHGELIATGRGADLITTAKFGDFKLHVEFKNGKSTNSGVYLRGRYELQIETDEAAQTGEFHTGGIYGFLAPNPEQPRVPDTWQTFDITLIGRRLTVQQNGITVIEDREIPGITGGALDSNEALPGPIYLQGSEDGPVAFRNIVIRPAKE